MGVKPGVTTGAMRRSVIAILAAMPLGLAACGGGHDIEVNGSKMDDAKLVKRDATRPLGPGDIRIASTDSALEVAIVGDSIVAGLGPKVRDKVAKDLDTSKVAASGFGASIEKMVKSTVASALDHEIQFPLSQISDVQADNGRLVFFDKDGKPMNMFKSGKDSDDSKTFSAADAEAFVTAFKAHKAKGA